MNSPLLPTALVLSSLLVPSAKADVLELVAVKDNTLYESPTGNRSNGAGDSLFSGLDAYGGIRRAVLQFDVAGSIPAGSIIESVRLTLQVTMTQAGPVDFALHELLTDWGEGASNATWMGGGGGAPAQTGDATWLHTFYDTMFWSVPAGDIDNVSSAIATVDNGWSVWESTPALLDDVQGWVDDPTTNFGWLIKQDDESGFQTAKRFASRENSNDTYRPKLEIGFSPPGGCHSRPYCLANTNSTGHSAHIFLSGSCSIADNNFTLISRVVPDQPGIFFAGDNQIQLPFHDGYLCVGGGIQRLKPIAFGMGNVATLALDLSSAGLAPGLKNFQYWYRDPMGGSGVNLSDAMQLFLLP